MPELRRILSLSLVPLGMMACALLTACGGDEDEPAAPDAIVMRTDSASYPLLALHEDGESLLLAKDSSGRIDGGIYTTRSGDSVRIWIGEDGVSTRAFSDGVLFLVRNHQDSAVDIAAILPDGTMAIEERVPYQANGALSFAPSQGSVDDLELVAIALGSRSCALGVVATPAGVGLGWVAFGCGSVALDVWSALSDDVVVDVSAVEAAKGPFGLSQLAVQGGKSLSVAAESGEQRLVGTVGIPIEDIQLTDLNPRSDDALDNGSGAEFEGEGIVFLPVTPGGRIAIGGTWFEVDAFYIAKHEITNAQYAAFVQAVDGFDNAAWWADMPADQSPPQRGVGDPWNIAPDAPRETVSWYQAVAFTRWLNARMAAKNAEISAGGLLVNGVEWEVRLPAEWEWQWAAQGGAEGREYPWGNWQAHANTFEAGVGETTAVGSYPLGAAASGALDMSGNVSEWCLSKWAAPYDITVDATNELLVYRGGSFRSDRGNTASSFRIRNRPHFASDNLGFRVGTFAAL